MDEKVMAALAAAPLFKVKIVAQFANFFEAWRLPAVTTARALKRGNC